MKGWECPKCSKVYSPQVEECRACNDARDIRSYTFIPIVQDTCLNGEAHDYPSHQVGTVCCRKCGKAVYPPTWTSGGSVSGGNFYSSPVRTITFAIGKEAS